MGHIKDFKEDINELTEEYVALEKKYGRRCVFAFILGAVIGGVIGCGIWWLFIKNDYTVSSLMAKNDGLVRENNYLKAELARRDTTIARLRETEITQPAASGNEEFAAYRESADKIIASLRKELESADKTITDMRALISNQQNGTVTMKRD